MQSGKYIAISALAFSLMPTLALGDNLKTMIMTAITEGKSTGYLDDDLVKGFASQTKSNEPVQINMERIQKYSDKCAELAIMTSQPGVPQKDGKMGVANLMFKLPICLDGSYPESLASMDTERKKAAMDKCRQTTRKGRVKNGFMEGSIDFNNCPQNGVVGIFYDGTCSDLGPGPTAIVKEFKIDEKGSLSIKMAIPKSCISAKVNKWQLYIFERRALMMPKELAGVRPVFW